MKKNFTLASILLTGIILNTGCEKKVTPIIPIVPNTQNTTPNYHEPISQHTQIESTNTYVNNNIQYEENINVISHEVTPIKETFDSYPSPIASQNQAIQNIPTPPQTSEAGYQLQTIQGQTIRVSERSTGLNFPQYQGKVILLQIFGKNCEYCFEEMPTIQKIQRKYGNKLQVIAIQGQEKMNSSTASHLIRKYAMNYPIIERDEARDVLSFISTTYNWMGVLPFLQIIKNGVTEATFADGGASYDDLSGVIDSL